jgi:hypothetical protein
MKGYVFLSNIKLSRLETTNIGFRFTYSVIFFKSIKGSRESTVYNLTRSKTGYQQEKQKQKYYLFSHNVGPLIDDELIVYTTNIFISKTILSFETNQIYKILS